MLATEPVAPSPTMGLSMEYDYTLVHDPLATSPKQLKKHKPLPHPASEHDACSEVTASRHQSSDSYHLVADASYTLSSSASQYSPSPIPHDLGQLSQSFRPHSPSSAGLDLPPTPPAHSHASAGAEHAALQSSLPMAEFVKPRQLPFSRRKPPITPPDQTSPPTPDVTPPQPKNTAKIVRHNRSEQSTTALGNTPTTDSRNDSFKTAQEDQFSEDDDHARSILASPTTSAQVSQSRRSLRASEAPTLPTQTQLQLLATQSLSSTAKRSTPRSMTEFRQFDGHWGPSRLPDKDRQQERKRDGTASQVAVKSKKRPTSKPPKATPSSPSKRELAEHHTVPTAANPAARRTQLRDKSALRTSPVSSFQSASDNSAIADASKHSSTSARSSSSTIVEVVVIHASSHSPPPRPTLRHVKKQSLLRQSSHAPPSNRDSHRRLTQPQRQHKGSPVRDRTRPPSTQMTSSNIGDSKARREIWNNGGIPVIVVPDRRSSNCSKSRELSLRSTSSRRSKQSASIGSPQRARDSLDISPTDSLPPRGYKSGTIRNEPTMESLPPVPPRTSSLSAPTSQNVSRTTSLTAESIRAHNAMQKREDQANQDRRLREAIPTIAVSAASPSSPKKTTDTQLSLEGADLYRAEDAMSSKKYSSRNTPFSVTSVATTGTVPEVSEAFAIQMYPHQNSSILMVNHLARHSDSSNANASAPKQGQTLPQTAPDVTVTDIENEPPATPPEQLAKPDDIDSPLQNPRAPPEPPVQPPMLNLIPATPSGATLSHESLKKLGYFYDALPVQRPCLMKRAFSRRRNSVDYPPTSSKPPGKRARSFSLTRSLGLSSESQSRPVFETDIDGETAPRRLRKAPVEKEKLHPFWRPLGQDEDCDYGDECPHHNKRYDNRPPLSRRSLGSRIKSTFAILPTQDNARHFVEDGAGTERRTIRRTPSGTLRVMQRRASMDSPPMPPQFWRGRSDARSSISPEQKTYSLRRDSTQHSATEDAGATGRRSRRFSLSDKWEDLQSISRTLHEKRRVKRTLELRQIISAPTQVRDGVGEVIRRGNVWRNHGNTWTRQETVV